MNTQYCSVIVFELEEELIPSDSWTEEMICQFPLYIQEELRFGSAPIGIGHDIDYGWFALGYGQGPFIIWAENGSPPVLYPF